MNFLSKKSYIAWYFVIPVVFIHLFVIGIPSILSLALCLTDWSGLGKINYVGFENFIELFDDRYFKKAIFHNILWTIIFLTVPAIGLVVIKEPFLVIKFSGEQLITE